jgi:hypothetical protein
MDLALAAGHTNISILDDLTTAAPFTIPGRGTEKMNENIRYTMNINIKMKRN